MIRSLTRSTLNNEVWYQSMLVGNEAYDPSAFDLLETTVLAVDTASVTFSNLNNYSKYKHLQLRIVGKDSFASSSQSYLWMRFNGVATGLPYSHHYLYSWSDNGTARSIASFGNNQIEIWTALASTTGTNVYSGAIIDILDFSNANKNTTIQCLAGADRGDSGGLANISLTSGFWNNTAAVTSIFLSSGVGGANLRAGSRFSLYGVKG